MFGFKKKTTEELQSEIKVLRAKRDSEANYARLKREHSQLKYAKIAAFGQRMGRGTKKFGSAIKTLAEQSEAKRKQMPRNKPDFANIMRM